MKKFEVKVWNGGDIVSQYCGLFSDSVAAIQDALERFGFDRGIRVAVVMQS